MNNPPAFPSHGSMGEVVQEGMSLRDYFAAQAMQALIIGRTWDKHALDSLQDTWAEGAYSIADAMLKVREQ